MSEELLIRYCSPTLAGLKTGNLFTAEYQSVKQAMEEITRLNQFFVPRGLRILPMRVMGKRMLIYLYRPGKLEQDFASPNVGDMLKAMGYPWGRTEQCVVCLFKRLRKNQEFPHEIGLFLGKCMVTQTLPGKNSGSTEYVRKITMRGGRKGVPFKSLR